MRLMAQNGGDDWASDLVARPRKAIAGILAISFIGIAGWSRALLNSGGAEIGLRHVVYTCKYTRTLHGTYSA